MKKEPEVLKKLIEEVEDLDLKIQEEVV